VARDECKTEVEQEEVLNIAGRNKKIKFSKGYEKMLRDFEHQ
jgi:hypothetical protein